MNINTKGMYVVREEGYTLYIEYTYYYSSGTHEQPTEANMEITNVFLNGMDITEFYWNYIDEQVHTDVWEHVQENH
tara:strand:- start:343 stop:570 length:228 start_codon:yes stop_codon:yes gene_type:complete